MKHLIKYLGDYWVMNKELNTFTKYNKSTAQMNKNKNKTEINT